MGQTRTVETGSRAGKAWAQAYFKENAAARDNLFRRAGVKLHVARPRNTVVVEIQARGKDDNVTGGKIVTSEKYAKKILKGAGHLAKGRTNSPEANAFRNATSVVATSNAVKAIGVAFRMLLPGKKRNSGAGNGRQSARGGGEDIHIPTAQELKGIQLRRTALLSTSKREHPSSRRALVPPNSGTPKPPPSQSKPPLIVSRRKTD